MKHNGIKLQLNILFIVALVLFTSSNLLAGSEIYYIHNDHLGTPQVVTDENQNIVWEGEYGPFGELISETGTLDQRIRFPGQYADEETGYYYNYYRDYDPSLGRYIQSDPIGILRDYSNPQMQVAIGMGALMQTPAAGEALNHSYGYVGQNPLNWVDPYGLAKGGNQNQRSAEFANMSDADVAKQARDPNATKEQRRKAQKEEKGRKNRNQQKRNKNGKKKGGKFGFGVPGALSIVCSVMGSSSFNPYCLPEPPPNCEI